MSARIFQFPARRFRKYGFRKYEREFAGTGLARRLADAGE
jgi:hypothetical protein